MRTKHTFEEWLTSLPTDAIKGSLQMVFADATLHLRIGDLLEQAWEAAQKPLREALNKIGFEEETSYLACAGPPHCAAGDIHYIRCPVEIARAAISAPEAQF